MLKIQGKLLILALFVVIVLATGQARLRLDGLTEPFRNDFREMLYLPRGKSLKLLSCGFDTPLADALFIKSLIYYAESFDANDKTGRRAYTYELFDVITDLSPRFHRAYQIGGLFLSSSTELKANQNGVRLLEKGVKTFTNIINSGEKIPTDPRWLFHILAANTYDVNIQARLRAMDDIEGASEARRLAAQEFVNAAKSPGAPSYVVAAASGYESVQKGNGNVEDALKATMAVWQELYAEAAARGDKDVLPDLESRIRDIEDTLNRISMTLTIEKLLGNAGQAYIARHNAPPSGIDDLLRDGLLQTPPPTFLSSEDEGEEKGEEDYWIALPNGSFKSAMLSAMEQLSHLELLFDATMAYRRAEGHMPPNLQTLVDEKIIDRIPEPPLAALGQIYEYNPVSGMTTAAMPQGPELPPDRR